MLIKFWKKKKYWRQEYTLIYISWNEMLFGIIQSKVVWKQLRNTRGRGVIATCFSNPKRIWYPPLLYWHLSGGSWWHSHTLSLNLLSIGLVTWRIVSMMVILFFSISRVKISWDSCGGQLNSTRWSCKTVNDAAAAASFFSLFLIPRVYIYLYLYRMYSMLVVVVVVLPGTTSLRIVSPYIFIGCCQQTIVLSLAS